MKSFINTNKITIFVFGLCFILLLMYSKNLSFMDEADNLLGAINVTNGYDIYKGYFSQHTPFVYYFISLFSLVGVRDYETFRLCMAFLILLTWFFLYIRYSDHFGKYVFLIFVAMYVLMLNTTWGYMVLSDVFQGFSILILMLELFLFYERRYLTKSSIIVISVGVFVSIMSAFVSVYSVFMIAILFLYCISTLKKEQTINNLKQYIILGICVISPFLLLIIWYSLTGNLSNFYEQAYTFNRLYYSKYLGGFGTSITSTFKGTLLTWTDHIKFSLLVINKDNFINTLLIIFNLLFLNMYFNKNKVFAIILFVFIGFCGVRGYTGFHAFTYYIVSFFNISFVLNYYLYSTETTNIKKMVIKFLAFLLIIFSLNNYIPNMGKDLFKEKGIIAQSGYDNYIQRLTDIKDKVWISSLTTQSYINNHRLSAVRASTLVPWFYDAYKDDILSDLSKNKPKLIIFEKDSDVWGHIYSEFAPELYSYINQHYKALNENDPVEKNIYVPKEQYEKISKELWPGAASLKEGTLVSNQTRIYLIENGTKRYIVSPEIFNRNGFKWDEVIEVDDETINTIKTGSPLDK